MSTAAAVASWLAFLALTSLALRLREGREALTVLIIAAACAPTGLIWPLVTGESLAFFAYVTVYGFLTAMSLLVFGALYKSISIKIITDLYDSPHRARDYNQVFQVYVANESFDSRIGVMQESGLAHKTADGFVLSSKGRRIATFVRRIQYLLAIEISG